MRLVKGLSCFTALCLMALLSSCSSASRQPETVSPNTLIDRGAKLYQANCQSCHGGATGGKLKDIPPPHNANGHTWDHADQWLTGAILNGITFSLEQQKMPAFKDKLTEEDVQAILAYIKTWWTEEQRASQKKVTEQWDR